LGRAPPGFSRAPQSSAGPPRPASPPPGPTPGWAVHHGPAASPLSNRWWEPPSKMAQPPEKKCFRTNFELGVRGGEGGRGCRLRWACLVNLGGGGPPFVGTGGGRPPTSSILGGGGRTLPITPMDLWGGGEGRGWVSGRGGGAPPHLLFNWVQGGGGVGSGPQRTVRSTQTQNKKGAPAGRSRPGTARISAPNCLPSFRNKGIVLPKVTIIDEPENLLRPSSMKFAQPGSLFFATHRAFRRGWVQGPLGAAAGAALPSPSGFPPAYHPAGTEPVGAFWPRPGAARPGTLDPAQCRSHRAEARPPVQPAALRTPHAPPLQPGVPRLSPLVRVCEVFLFVLKIVVPVDL